MTRPRPRRGDDEAWVAQAFARYLPSEPVHPSEQAAGQQERPDGLNSTGRVNPSERNPAGRTGYSGRSAFNGRHL